MDNVLGLRPRKKDEKRTVLFSPALCDADPNSEKQWLSVVEEMLAFSLSSNIIMMQKATKSFALEARPFQLPHTKKERATARKQAHSQRPSHHRSYTEVQFLFWAAAGGGAVFWKRGRHEPSPRLRRVPCSRLVEKQPTTTFAGASDLNHLGRSTRGERTDFNHFLQSRAM
jgi:hypothetical protein